MIPKVMDERPSCQMPTILCFMEMGSLSRSVSTIIKTMHGLSPEPQIVYCA